MIADSIIGTACQSPEEFGQLARVVVVDQWTWVDAVGDFMTVIHRNRQPLDGLR
jgi:hypothetical protein